jgi:hypothetical protein
MTYCGLMLCFQIEIVQIPDPNGIFSNNILQFTLAIGHCQEHQLCDLRLRYQWRHTKCQVTLSRDKITPVLDLSACNIKTELGI